MRPNSAIRGTNPFLHYCVTDRARMAHAFPLDQLDALLLDPRLAPSFNNDSAREIHGSEAPRMALGKRLQCRDDNRFECARGFHGEEMLRLEFGRRLVGAIEHRKISSRASEISPDKQARSLSLLPDCRSRRAGFDKAVSDCRTFDTWRSRRVGCSWQTWRRE